eukprot:COSAG05_NODE_5495_length_1159_cov_1.066038_2_plen_268_part_01
MSAANLTLRNNRHSNQRNENNDEAVNTCSAEEVAEASNAVITDNQSAALADDQSAKSPAAKLISHNNQHNENQVGDAADDSLASDNDQTISHDQDQLAQGQSKSTGVSGASNRQKKHQNLKQKKAARKKTKMTIHKKKAAGKVNNRKRNGYVALAGVEKTTGQLRSCMQDTVVQGVEMLGGQIDKEQLMRECPPRKTKNTSLEELEAAPTINSVVAFIPQTHIYAKIKGGPEAALVNETDGCIRFVSTTVHGSTTEEHAFILSSSIMK